MPDELSASAPPPAAAAAARPGRAPAGVLAGQVVAILALFAALAAAAGWVWFRLWDAPPGVVAKGTWYPDPYMPGQAAEFDAVATYVLVAGAVGVLGGVACAFLLDRAEVVTVAAVAVGSALGAWLMAQVGTALGPADPEELARTAADGTRLAGDLTLTGISPYVAMPLGALAAIFVVFLATPDRRPAEPRLGSVAGG